jgi:hypothetical protein
MHNPSTKPRARQLLAKEINLQQASEEAAEKQAAAGRRIAFLEKSVKSVREDQQTKLRELETTIRVLSGRSEMHRVVACLRQELAAERVSSVYLRGELDLHKRLLNEEEERSAELRRRADALQTALDDIRVAQSLRQIPGVPALAIIEHFATSSEVQAQVIQELKGRLGPQGLAGPAPRGQGRGSGGGGRAAEGALQSPTALGLTPRDRGAQLREHTLSRHFGYMVETHQLAERNRRLEEDLAEAKEEMIHLRLESMASREAVRKEKEAIEEGQRNVVAALERKLEAAQAECTRLRAQVQTGRTTSLTVHHKLDDEDADPLPPRKSAVHSRGEEETKPTAHPAHDARDAEISKLRSLLEERSLQVSVLMESMETLQAAVSAAREHEAGIEESKGLGQWAIPKLVRRVVALTMEASNAAALTSMMERRAEDLLLELKAHDRGGPSSDDGGLTASEVAQLRIRLKARSEEYHRVLTLREQRIGELSKESEDLRRQLSDAVGEAAVSKEQLKQFEDKVRHLEQVLALSPSSVTDQASGPTAEVGRMAGGGEPFCETCGRLLPQQPVGADHHTREEDALAVPSSSTYSSYIDLLREVLRNVQKWHEAEEAALPDAELRPDEATGGTAGSWLDFFVETVADIFTSADLQYVSLVKQVRSLQWKLRNSQLEAMEGAREKEGWLREREVMRRHEAYLKGQLLKRSWSDAMEGQEVISQLEERCKRQYEAFARAESQLIWALSEKNWLEEQVDSLAGKAASALRRAEVADAKVGTLLVGAREEGRQELEARLSDLEASVIEWCQRELPELTHGYGAGSFGAGKGNASDDSLTAEALCASRAANAALQLRLDSAVRSLDALKAQHASLLKATERWDSDLVEVKQDPPARASSADGEVEALRGRLAELEEGIFEARQAQQRTERLLKRCSLENEALRNAAQMALEDQEAHKEQLQKQIKDVLRGSERRQAQEVAKLRQQSQKVEAKLREELRALRAAQRQAQAEVQPPRPAHAASTFRADVPFPPPSDVVASVEPAECPEAAKDHAQLDWERLVGRCAELDAQCRVLEEEVLTKEQAIQALKAAYVRLTPTLPGGLGDHEAGDVEGEGSLFDVRRLVDELAQSRLQEATALRRLRLAADSEIRLRRALQAQAGDPSGRDFLGARKEEGLVGLPVYGTMFPGLDEGITNQDDDLSAKVTRQAAVIAYLELRLSELLATSPDEHPHLGDVEDPDESSLLEPLAPPRPYRRGLYEVSGESDDLDPGLGPSSSTDTALGGGQALSGGRRPLRYQDSSDMSSEAREGAPRNRQRSRSRGRRQRLDSDLSMDEPPRLPGRQKGPARPSRDQASSGGMEDSDSKELSRLKGLLESERRSRVEDQAKLADAQRAMEGLRDRVIDQSQTIEGLTRSLEQQRAEAGPPTLPADGDGDKSALPSSSPPPIALAAPVIRICSRKDAAVQVEDLPTEATAPTRAREEADPSSPLPPGSVAIPPEVSARITALAARLHDERQGVASLTEEEVRALVEECRGLIPSPADAEVKDADATDAAAESEEMAREKAKEDERLTQALASLRKQLVEISRQAEAKRKSLMEEWQADKTEMEGRVLELRHELLRQRASHAQALSAVRDTYDKALQEMETAAEMQSTTSEEEVIGLRKVLREVRTRLRAQRDRSLSADLIGEEDAQQPRDESKHGEATRPTSRRRRGGKLDQSDSAPEALDVLEPLLTEPEDPPAQRQLVRAPTPPSRSAERLYGLEDELRELQALYRDARHELEELAHRLAESDAARRDEAQAHREQLTTVRNDFRTFREKQANVVGRLEHRLQQAQAALEQARLRAKRPSQGGPTRAGGGAVAGNAKPGMTPSPENQELLDTLAERDRQLGTSLGKTQRLEMEFRRASAERDAAVNAALAAGAQAVLAQGSAAREEHKRLTGESPIPSAEAGSSQFHFPELLQAMVNESRLALAEQENAELVRVLETEREASQELRREVAARILQTAHLRRRKAPPSTQSLLKQLQDLKKTSKAETTRLRSVVKRLQARLPQGKDHEELRKAMAECQSALQAAKEDLARKAKLLASYQATRAADERAIEQWKAEVALLEERCRSLGREVYRKDQLVKELRARLGSSRGEGRASAEDEGMVAVSGPSGRYQFNDERVGKVVAERDRLRQRCSVLEKKVMEQAAALEDAQARVRALEDLEDKAAALKASVVRKESLLRAAKAKIVAYAQELAELKAAASQWQQEAEKHLKLLQRRSHEHQAREDTLDDLRAQLQALAQVDGPRVQSLILKVLASLHDQEQGEQTTPVPAPVLAPAPTEALPPFLPPPEPPVATGSRLRSRGGSVQRVPGDGGAEEQKLTATRAQEKAERRDGPATESGNEEEEAVNDLIGKIDAILALPSARQSGDELATLVDKLIGPQTRERLALGSSLALINDAKCADSS